MTGDGDVWSEVGIAISPGRSFSLEASRVGGGYSEDGGVESWALRAGIPIAPWGVRLCPFAGFEMNQFSYIDRFDADRGTAEYRVREAGMRVDWRLIDTDPLTVGAWASPAVAYQVFENRGRTLTVGDDISVEVRTRGGSTWRLAGSAGLNARWKRLGGSIGLSRRPALHEATLLFAQIGVAIVSTNDVSR